MTKDEEKKENMANLIIQMYLLIKYFIGLGGKNTIAIATKRSQIYDDKNLMYYMKKRSNSYVIKQKVIDLPTKDKERIKVGEKGLSLKR